MGLIMAGAALAAVPIVTVFLVFQKSFTQGITMGGRLKVNTLRKLNIVQFCLSVCRSIVDRLKRIQDYISVYKMERSWLLHEVLLDTYKLDF